MQKFSFSKYLTAFFHIFISFITLFSLQATFLRRTQPIIHELSRMYYNIKNSIKKTVVFCDIVKKREGRMQKTLFIASQNASL